MKGKLGYIYFILLLKEKAGLYINIQNIQMRVYSAFTQLLNSSSKIENESLDPLYVVVIFAKFGMFITLQISKKHISFINF